MAATVTLELPESVLVQALKRLPLAHRRQIWLSLEVEARLHSTMPRPAVKA